MEPTNTTSVYELLNTINGIRQGILQTRAGKVHTPLFMPVGTRGAVKSLSPDQVASTKAQIILANTYHLHLQPGEKTINKLGGLHAFTQWKGPILTDSGGFQVFSLGHINKITEDGVTFKDPKTGDSIFLSPEKSMQIQIMFGSDIIMAFDDVVGLDEVSRKRETEAFERTHRWLDRSITEFKKLTKGIKPANRPLLFGIAQGGLDKDLRRKSLEMVQATDVDGIAIGGLSVGEPRPEMHDMLDYLATYYDPKRPHYLMGVGDPVDMRFAIEHGIDMFDCVLPTRNARHATAWIHKPCTCGVKPGKARPAAASRSISYASPLRSSVAVPKVRLSEGTRNSDATRLECKTCGGRGYVDTKIHLTNLKFAEDTSVIDPGCDCYTCKKGYSRGFLRHQFKVGEPLAGSLVSIHNIRYLERLCEDYRK